MPRLTAHSLDRVTRTSSLVVLLLLLFALTAQPLWAQEKSLVWDRFDVDIVVNKDGSFDVSEHQTIHFTSGSFTNGYRLIDKRNFESIDNFSVTDASGNNYQEASAGNDPYTFTVEDNYNNYTINWYFPPASRTSETYTLNYTVHGGLRIYEGGDQLWWKAIYSDRPFPVNASHIRVIVPEGAPIQEWQAYINSEDAKGPVTAEVLEGKQAVLYDLHRSLASGEELEVRVQFQHGVVDASAPAWQAQADADAAAQAAHEAELAKQRPIYNLGLGVLGLICILGGPAGLYLLWYNYGRDKPVPMVADYLPEAPDSLTPGIVGALLDETVDMEDVLATLVDLARRKAISITEVKEDGWFRTGYDFVYRRELQDVPLQPYEAELIKGIFGNKDEVKLSALKNKFYTKLPGIRKAMYAALVESDLFPRNPQNVRYLYYAVGVLSMFLAAVVGCVVFGMFGEIAPFASVLPGFGLGITALGMIGLAHAMPRKTDHGSEIAARWRAFRTYLKNIEKYSDLDAQKEIWDRWLPYAIAFGFEKDYIRKFDSVQAPPPGWYIPGQEYYGPYRGWYYGGGPRPQSSGGGLPNLGGGGSGEKGGSSGGGLGDMSRGMAGSLTAMSTGLSTMLTSASTALTSQPASTGSSSGGGWSGGGGGFR